MGSLPSSATFRSDGGLDETRYYDPTGAFWVIARHNCSIKDWWRIEGCARRVGLRAAVKNTVKICIVSSGLVRQT